MRILGLIMLFSPLVALFLYSTYEYGALPTLGVFGAAAVLVVWLAVASALVEK